MTNIIIMLVLLTGPYLLVRFLSPKGWAIDLRGAAAWGAAALFVFTGIGHFVQTAQLTWMLPEWIPQRVLLVYVTGVLEFAIAGGLLVRRTRWAAGVAAIIVLVGFFPANVFAAFKQIPMSGNEWGPIYLLVRGPMQAVIIGWIYGFVVRGQSMDVHNQRGAA